jgi:putative DNA primase/helicase
MAESRIDRINEMLDESTRSGESLDDVALRLTEAKKTQQRPKSPYVNGSNGHGNGTVLGFSLTRMSDVEMRPVEWLWQGKIPIGKVSGISGDPGLGKSQLTASMAAIVSRGGQWPVTRDRAPLGNVILLNAEDDADDTIGPRLEAAGADLSRVFILNAIKVEMQDGEEGERSFDLSKDIKNLQDCMAQVGDVRLVIIDPVSAYMGKVDSHNNAEVRGVLSPLKDAAAKHGAAIVLVTHLNKSQTSSALHRTQGSVAFTGAPRAVWGVVKDKENPARRLFVPLKNNLGPDTEGLAYTVEGWRLEGSDPAIDTSRILWENEAITQSADELMRDSGSEGHGTVKDAEEFLADILCNGWLKTAEIQTAAKKAGVSWASVRRAKDNLKVVAKKNAFTAGWGWEFPEDGK